MQIIDIPFEYLVSGAILVLFLISFTGGLMGVKINAWFKNRKRRIIQAKEARELVRKPKLMLDNTKRKSLQPGNRLGRLPPGWDAVKDSKSLVPKVPKTRVAGAPKTPPLPQTFQHVFFGTQIMVGNSRVIGGLDKGLHRMEIIKDQLYIDNKPMKVNTGDLERIKQLVRDGRA